MDLNPFNLRGPEFLGFFCLAMLVVGAGVWLALRWLEGGELDQDDLLAQEVAKDPYQVALLRGGLTEVVRVAVVSLLERGLLQAKGELLAATAPDVATKVRRPLDKAILGRLASWSPARSLLADSVVLSESEAVRRPLRELRLIPDPRILAGRLRVTVTALAVLWGLAGVKIWVALARGHSNIGFLILLALLSLVLLAMVTARARTVLGARVCARIQRVFEPLRTRRHGLELHETTSEFTYLAAVFGLATLPAAMAGPVEALRLKSPPQTHSGSGCGSSGCGGGSCGGGCGGGCGGCG